jgi:hypothetical protein
VYKLLCPSFSSLPTAILPGKPLLPKELPKELLPYCQGCNATRRLKNKQKALLTLLRLEKCASKVEGRIHCFLETMLKDKYIGTSYVKWFL